MIIFGFEIKRVVDRSPVSRMCDAVDEFNAAWKDHFNDVSKHRITPWIDWSQKLLVLTVRRGSGPSRDVVYPDDYEEE